MASLEINRKYSCLFESNVVFNFEDLQNQSKIVSNKIPVPEIDAVWWITVRPGGEHATFATLRTPPTLKVQIEFFNESMATSKQFEATITVKDTDSDFRDSGYYYKSHVVGILSAKTEIETLSDEYHQLIRDDMIDHDYNIYVNDERHDILRMARREQPTYTIWEYKKIYTFDCSIAFKFYFGSTHGFSQSIKDLMSNRILESNSTTSFVIGDEFADFTFFVRDVEIKAHKYVLCAASDVMRTMFTCGLTEATNNSATVNCKPEIFSHFLTFIYTNALPETEMPSICFELYELANRYGIESLKKICAGFILDKEINHANALEFYEFSSTYEFGELLDASWSYIKVMMLKIFEPCEPKPLKSVREIIDEMKKYEESRRLFIATKPPQGDAMMSLN